jgi:hypothetical protein
MKKIFWTVLLLIVIILLIFNYRTPFFTIEKGGWSVGYGYFNSLNDSKNISKDQLFSIEKLTQFSDSTSFLADPFFIKEKDTFYLFFEHQKKKPNAEIGLMVSTDGKNYTYKGTVLKEKFHLSYPQVFKYKNNYYMLPETQGANHVLLYKASNFPYRWEVSDTLIKNIKLKDPTIFLSDTLNILLGSDSEMNLYAYESNSLNNKWKLHRKAIVMRGTESRCGGRIIPQDDGLIVPIQNCSHGYGYGLSLYKIRFTSNDYSVEKVGHLHFKANKSIKEFNGGMHHIDIQPIDGNKFYAVYDGNTVIDNGSIKFNIKGPLKWNYIDLINWLSLK